MNTHTYQQIAEDFRLWTEYADPHSTMTRAEFDALDIQQRIKILIDAFGDQTITARARGRNFSSVHDAIAHATGDKNWSRKLT